MGTGFSRDPLINKGIPRQFLRHSPFDWAIPIVADFYLREPQETSSLRWLGKVLLKRFQSSSQFSSHLLDLALLLSGRCHDRGLQVTPWANF